MTSKKPVILYYDPNAKAGPGKVIQNLKLGLDKLNIKHYLGYQNDDQVYVGVIQLMTNYQKLVEKFKETIAGPNLFVLPSEQKEFCKSFKHFIVPSQWTLDLYRQFRELDHATIDIWPVGIDTELWKPSENKLKAPRPLGLIYHKDRAAQDLELAKRLVAKAGADYIVLPYGNYKEMELLEAVQKVDFSILLTGTESQGIAINQIMASNVPCYVFNKEYWDYNGQYKKVSATSVPYFDDRCGVISPNKITVLHFKEFLEKLDTFNPRQYILENLDLCRQAQKYYDLLEKYQGQ